MSDDTYNGWTNRETWALNLWLTNDQGLYEMTRERVASALEFDGYHASPARQAGEAVQDFYAELTDPSKGLLSADEALKMVQDVGSDYRIDWDEIGAYWISDLDES